MLVDPVVLRGTLTMQTLRALLIDLDGVIYQDEEVVPGASDALAWVRARAIPHAFITNTTSRPRRALVEKLVRFGVPARDEQIFTPLSPPPNGCGAKRAGRPRSSYR